MRMLSLTEPHSASASIPRGEKIARLVMWAPLLAGALAVVASQRTVLWRWVHHLLDDSADGVKRSENFARTIVGRSRESIVLLIGSPSATARNTHGQEQWYYPVSGRKRVALAVTFQNDRVLAATVLRGLVPTAGAPAMLRNEG